jgi:predicted methyltransferase
MVVLSHFQAHPILEARQNRQDEALASLDLGLTTARVKIEAARVIFPDGQSLDWGALEKIADAAAACFVVEGNTAKKIQFFSEALDRHYSLMPTQRAPTMLISGLPMHRIKGIDPHEDTLRKMKAIAPLHGRVLDTATGLGYTAIQAAQSAEQVVTIELDATALQVARLNPWSQALFDNPRIQQIVGDSFEEVPHFDGESFSCVVHDPPTFSLAGELYSEEFYRELYRVLRRNGRLFHYIGDLDSPSGARVSKGAMRRLQSAGFARVVRRPEAFGLVAYK